MPKQSAGILLYKQHQAALQIFLVHPGGPFYKNKDEGSWTIPKGEFLPDEDALSAAKREFTEETGKMIDGEFLPLKPIKQKAGKTVYAWAVAGDIDPAELISNTFALEWPPRSGKIVDFPEVDIGGWFSVSQARIKINAAQAVLIDDLADQLLKS